MSGDKDIDDDFATQDEDLGDENYDEGDAGEDGEFGDEDWESYDEEEGAGESEDETPRKKDSSQFNKIIIGAAVVLGIGVLGFNVMKGAPAPQQPAPQPPAQQAAATPAAAPAAEANRQRLNSASLATSSPTTQRDVVYGRHREDAMVDAAENTAADTGGGILNDLSEVEKIEQYRQQIDDELITAEEAALEAQNAASAAPDQAQPQPAETPQIVSQEPPQELPMPVPMAQSDVLTPLPTTPEDAPSVGLPRAQDLTMAGADAPAAAETIDAPVSPFGDEPAGVTEAPPVIADVPAPASPVVAPAAEAVVVDSPVPAIAPAEVAALNEKIAELQKQLDERSGKVKDLESTVRQLERALEIKSASPAEEPVAAAPAPRKAVSRPAAEESTRSAPKKAAPAVRWVLKSAQPGRAMVSRAGEHEMRSIAVGDTLPGVGRVVQIYQGSGGWIVEGTTGRILQ